MAFVSYLLVLSFTQNNRHGRIASPRFRQPATPPRAGGDGCWNPAAADADPAPLARGGGTARGGHDRQPWHRLSAAALLVPRGDRYQRLAQHLSGDPLAQGLKDQPR